MEMLNGMIGGTAMQTTHSTLILGVLLGCSLICVALIVERLLYFQRIKIDPEKSLMKIRKAVVAGDTESALQMLGDAEGNPVLSVIQAGIKNAELPREQVTEIMRACVMKQRIAMERNLGVLGTLGNTAPFIGLLGTVLGIIQAFHDLAGPQAAANGASVVAVGIAEALVATAAGLTVAIPAVIFYNIFLKKVKLLLMNLEVVITEMSVLLSLKESKAGAGHASR